MFCATAAVSAAAFGSTADVSGVYAIAIDDGTPVQGLLYLLRGAGGDYVGVLNDSFCSVEHDSDALGPPMAEASMLIDRISVESRRSGPAIENHADRIEKHALRSASAGR
jgi:hypothetical protein